MAEQADGPLAKPGAGVAVKDAANAVVGLPTPVVTGPAVDLTPTTGSNSSSPTLEDVARLTVDSDYSAFTAASVDAQVRNQALRKLFLSDPHFQQSDGLDVAIDDVVQIAQSPLARQRKIMQARALGLLDDDLLDQPEPEDDQPVR
jgi:hypothetical protein